MCVSGQEWLGHANISTTRLYDRRNTRAEVFRRALDAVEALPGDRNLTMHSGLSDTAGAP